MYVLCFTRLRYQVSVYRTIDPLVVYDMSLLLFTVILRGYLISIAYCLFFICIYIIIDKIYVVIVKHCFFRKFAIELGPLIDVRIWFLLNILRNNKQIETKFCIHIIIDKVYVGIVNLIFFLNLQQSYCP